MGISNQITFIDLVSSKNYYRRPRIITLIALGWDTTGWNTFGRECRGRVRGKLLGRGTATMHPVAA